eukprot:4875206-Pyramimonas_sp.AAC.1
MFLGVLACVEDFKFPVWLGGASPGAGHVQAGEPPPRPLRTPRDPRRPRPPAVRPLGRLRSASFL